ncbi:MAG TPA: AMP-binding protein, partial [Candidatus Acidoferrum sp.]|nr:AMP-binding protein [Candidatus Acidoferrum sp.]
FPVAALGAFKTGAVVVNINPLYTPQELLGILHDSGAAVLVVLANVAHTVAAVIERTSVQRVVITEVGDLLGPVAGWLTNFAVRHVRKMIRHYHIGGSLRFAHVLQRGSALQHRHGVPAANYPADDLAVLQYTGGTTGVSKAAMLTHRNLLDNVGQIVETMQHDCPGSGALMVAPLPLYHIYAFCLNFLLSQHKGHHVLLIPNPRDADGMAKTLAKVRMNGFIGINTLYQNLVNHAGFRRLDFSHLQVATSGGMALSPQVVARWLELTGKSILEGYGLTECSPMVSCNTYAQQRLGTAGKVARRTELRLVQADGSLAAVDEPGEICVRGPQVMRGYWNNATETAQVLDAEGWLRTGDIGKLDADGFLTIVDRIKDLIVVSGFNVYPAEIEEHVLRHPDISDACAIGCGDDLAPRIKLFIVSRNPALTAEQVLTHCRGGLAGYKVPKEVEFRSTLPKSAVGKVLRRELRQQSA